MRNVLVTGGTGFIGGFLLPELKRHAGSVRVLTRQRDTRSAGPAPVLHVGDLADAGSLRNAVREIDTVFHLAGYAHATSRPYPEELERHRRINLEGSLNLYRAAADSGVRRFVFVSSVKAVGEDPHRCLDEYSAVSPSDPYGRIKREIELRLLESAARDGVEVVIVRPALVYGPGVKGNLAAMLRWIDRGLFPPMPDTGNIRSMISVHDLVDALIAAAVSPHAAGKAYILTDDEAYSTRRIYLGMVAALGRTPPGWSVPPSLLRGLGRLGDLAESVSRRELPLNTTTVARLLESACYQSRIARTELEFRPRYCLEDLLGAIVERYRTEHRRG